MADFFKGSNAALLYGTAGGAFATLVAMTNVKDVTVNLTATDADTTTRANSGWRGTAAGLKEATLEFEMVSKTTDAGFTAVQTAFINGTTIEILPLDQPADTVGAQGPKASWSITDFSRSEPLEDIIKVSVTAKVETFDEWYTVAS